jgi:Cu/Ag efflux pump CusA
LRSAIDACIRFRLIVIVVAAALTAAATLRLATMPSAAPHNLRVALAGTGVLAVLALLALLLQLRLSFAALLGAAISLVAATAVLALVGYAFSAVVTLGLLLALAFVVAEGVGAAQGIVTRLGTRQPGRGPVQTQRLVAAACGDLRGALCCAGLAALLCAAPLLLATGPTAAFLRPAAAGFVLAVAVSMVVAVTVTPALAAVLLTVVPPQIHGTPLPRSLARGYARTVAALDRSPNLLLAGGAVSVVAGTAALALLPGMHASLPGAGGTSRGVFFGYIVLALAGVLGITAAATRGWRLAALAFGTMPVSLSGGVFTAYALGATSQVAAAAGLLAVAALAARQAIAVTARAVPYMDEVAGAAGAPLASGADAAGWFAEIMTPAVVTALVVAPFIAMGGLPGMQLLRTAAAVLLGGLATTTLVSLFGLPVACPRVARLSGPPRELPRSGG